MPAKAIISGFLLVIMAVIVVFTVEFFLPLSVKSDMNVLCRSTLLKMENEGGMSDSTRTELSSSLTNRGFANVIVDGTGGARQGSELTLRVEADYSYSRLTSVFTRSACVQHMTYNKTAISRRVIN